MLKRFVPYGLEDLGVIIRTCVPHTQRLSWEAFWAQFCAVTPKTVLGNTVIAIHLLGEKENWTTEQLSKVGEVGENGPNGSRLVWTHSEVRDVISPILRGLEVNHCRLIASLDDDVLLDETWALEAVRVFNQEPHFKMLGQFVSGGDPISWLREKCHAPWLQRLLDHNEPSAGLEFLLGSFVIANRAIWMGYYPLLAGQADPGHSTDVLFTLLSRADGVMVQGFGHHLIGQKKGTQAYHPDDYGSPIDLAIELGFPGP